MPDTLSTDPLEEYYKKYDPSQYEDYMERKKKETLQMRTHNILSGQETLQRDYSRGLDAPRGTISSLVDVLSRGNYGAAKFSDVLINEEGDLLAKLWEGLKEGSQEIVNPEERLIFKDVIQRANPVWAANNKVATSVLGFVSDVVVDPLNLLTFGAGSLFRKGISVTAKNTGKLITLNKAGEKVFQRISSKLTGEAGEKLVHNPSTLEVLQEIVAPSKSPLPTLGEKKLTEASIRKNISELSEELGNDWVAIRTDTSLLDINKVIDGGELNLLSRNNLKKAIKDPDKGTLFAATPLDEIKVLQEVANYSLKGSNKTIGEGVGILIPRKYYKKIINDPVKDTRQVLIGTKLDPNDLRYVVPGPGNNKALTRSEFDFWRKEQSIKRRLEIKQLKETQAFGDEIMREMNLAAKDIIDPGGFKIAGKSVKKGVNRVSEALFDKPFTQEHILNFMNKVGATKALKDISDLPGISQLKSAAKWTGLHAKVLKDDLSLNFNLSNRLQKVAPEWMRFRHLVESERTNAYRNAVHLYNETFKGLVKAEREEIGYFLAKVSQETKTAAEKAGMNTPNFQLGKKVLQQAVDSSKLTTKQKKVVRLLSQNYQDWYKTEALTGSVKDFFANYAPARYEAISKAAQYKQYRAWQNAQHIDPKTGKQVTPSSDFSFKKVFESPEQAEAAGYKPILDSGRLFMLRYLEHQSAIRKFEWERFIKDQYGSLEKAPIEVKKDLFRLGERVYVENKSLAGQWAGEFVHSLGKVFRKTATVARPSFGVKQIVSNMFQVGAKLGSDTFHMFDPTILNDAFNVAIKEGHEIPFGIKTIFGESYSPEKLKELFEKYPVLKGISIEDVGALSEGDLVRRVTDDIYNKVVTQTPEYKTSAGDGLKKLFAMGSGYLDWPAKIEDFYRTSTFLTALRLGNSPEAAMKIVDDALFNYKTSLTNAEKKLRGSIIPFYSFQRFGTELLAKTIFQTPGRAAFLVKASPIPIGERNKEFFRLFNEVTNGEVLTDAERQVTPDYLMAQPNSFQGFDTTTGLIAAKFRTYNSMVFMDVVNAVQVDEKGEFDIRETLIKGAAAQMAPWIKVPLETLAGRKFFNDELLTGPSAGSVGDIDYDHFLASVAGSIGSYLGATGVAAGTAAGYGAANNEYLEKFTKWLIGWDEQGVDPVTGRKKVYISPSKWHWISAMFPSVGYGKTIARNDMTNMDKILYGTFGIGTTRVDLAKSAHYKTNEMQRRYDEKLYEYNRYLNQGRKGKADLIVEELKEILEYNSQEMANWKGEIRGGVAE